MGGTDTVGLLPPYERQKPMARAMGFFVNVWIVNEKLLQPQHLLIDLVHAFGHFTPGKFLLDALAADSP